MANRQVTMLVLLGWVLTLSMLVGRAVAVDSCSSLYPGGPVCVCNITSTSFSYDCSRKQLEYVPTGLNSSGTTLNLSYNKLSTMIKGTLNHMDNLKVLYLQYNSMLYIQPGTFDGLMKLTQLILTNNILTDIGRETFRHLPALEVLDLSNNLLKNIDGHAFFTLPSLYLVNLKSSALNCSCQERILQEFIDYRGAKLTVNEAWCANHGKALSSVWSSISCAANTTLFNPSTTCYLCAGAAGVNACAAQTRQSCTSPVSVCYNRIDYYYHGHLAVSGGCIDYTTCMNQEKQNQETCRNGTNSTTCYFCNPDSLSNNKDVIDTTKEFNVTVLMTLDSDMTPQLADPYSSTYASFTSNLAIQVQTFFLNQKGAFRVSFLDLRSPRVTAAFSVHCATIWYVKKEDVMKAMADALYGRQFNAFKVTDVRVFISGDVPCSGETTTDATYGSFVWPLTNAGTVAFIKCPYQLQGSYVFKYASRHCERQSDGSGLWKAPLVSNCPHADESSRTLQQISQSDITNGNVGQVASSLNNLTSNWNQFKSAQVDWSVSTIDKILATDLSKTSRDVISDTMDSINNLLFITTEVLTQSEKDNRASNRLVRSVEKLLTSISVSGEDYVAIKENIVGIVTSTTGTSFNGLVMSYTKNEHNTLTENQVTYNKGVASIEADKSEIVLPSNLLDSITQKIDKVSLALFKDPKLFSSITNTNETKTVYRDNGEAVTAERKINSNVISATVPGAVIRDLQSPVVVTLHHFNHGDNVSCVFWDTTSGSWRSDGCSVNVTSTEFTVCHCNHLTNFALLMDVYSVGVDQLALAIISYIGCGLSLLGICLTMITYLKFRKLRRDNPSKILMNLCIAIGLLDVVFLAGVQPYTSSSTAGCKAVGVLLHYFLLAIMCWMVVEAFYMYLALVKVFDTYVAHFQLKSALFGWGVPLVVLALTLGINKTNNYGLQPGGICWLSRIPFYVAFLAPVCIVLLVNTVVFVLVIRQIIRRSSKKLTKTDSSSTAARLRGAISLVVLLGLTWVFAFLAVGNFGIAFHYLFALFNSLQGFFIFVFYCLLKKEAQQCWKKALPCFKSPYEKNISTNTQSQGDSNSLSSSKTTESKLTKGSGDTETRPGNTAFRGNWRVQVKERNSASDV